MSIYASFGDISADNPVSGEPVVYQGSHVFPNPDTDPRGGSVDLGEIPKYIHRDHDDGVYPLLRVCVRGELAQPEPDTVVLTGAQVRLLRDHLNVWLVRADVEAGDWWDMEQARRARWGAAS